MDSVLLLAAADCLGVQGGAGGCTEPGFEGITTHIHHQRGVLEQRHIESQRSIFHFIFVAGQPLFVWEDGLVQLYNPYSHSVGGGLENSKDAVCPPLKLGWHRCCMCVPNVR